MNMKEKTFWSMEPDKPNKRTVWSKLDDRQKKRKVTPKEPRTWAQDEDNIREVMRNSCDKGSCIFPQ